MSQNVKNVLIVASAMIALYILNPAAEDHGNTYLSKQFGHISSALTGDGFGSFLIGNLLKGEFITKVYYEDLLFFSFLTDRATGKIVTFGVLGFVKVVNNVQ